MQPSDRPKKIRLTVDAHDPMVEIYVIDGRFNLAARGVGYLKETLPPGIYTVKFKAGSVIKEVDAILEPGKGPVTVHPPEMDISTSAPLKNTRTSRSQHLDSACVLSQEVHESIGQGAQLFVFIRDLEEQARTDPARGLSLRTLDGKQIVNFAKAGRRSQAELWAGCTVALSPGIYRLRVQKRASGILEQTVVVCEGWQTQVFLLRRTYGTSRLRTRYADNANASILMARLGEGFMPDREDLRWTETARLGLSEGHTILPSSILNEMLWEKYSNPMLGIFASCLLLGTKNPNLGLLSQVITRLEGLLGPHPDVTALKVRLATLGMTPPGEVHAYEAPPMLRTSWDYVLEGSVNYPSLVPPDSLAARVSPHLWGGGTWLVWNTPSPAEPPTSDNYAQASLPDSSELNAVLPELRVMLSRSGSVDAIAQHSGLDEIEKSLLEYMSILATPSPFKSAPPPEEDKQQIGGFDETPEVDRLSEESLIQALGVPNLTARQTAASLISKLKLRSS